jgi:hypothetical protein
MINYHNSDSDWKSESESQILFYIFFNEFDKGLDKSGRLVKSKKWKLFNL